MLHTFQDHTRTAAQNRHPSRKTVGLRSHRKKTTADLLSELGAKLQNRVLVNFDYPSQLVIVAEHREAQIQKLGLDGEGEMAG